MSKPILIQEVESKAQKTYVDNLKISSLIPRGQLVNTVPSNNLNDVKTQGCYLILGTELNIPQNMGSFGTLICYVGGTGAIIQEVIRQYTGIRWYREFNGQSWQPWKEIATTDVAMTKLPVLRDTDLKEYIKNLEQSCTFYVHNSCTNTPIASRFFICQVYCHTNQARYSDKHIEIQEYTSKRQFYADSWNKENFVWKEYATLEKAQIPFPYVTGFMDIDTSANVSLISKTNNIVEILANIRKVDGTAFGISSTNPIVSLPVGFRPKTAIRIEASSSSPSYGATASILISPNGNIYLRALSNTSVASITFDTRYEGV